MRRRLLIRLLFALATVVLLVAGWVLAYSWFFVLVIVLAFSLARLTATRSAGDGSVISRWRLMLLVLTVVAAQVVAGLTIIAVQPEPDCTTELGRGYYYSYIDGRCVGNLEFDRGQSLYDRWLRGVVSRAGAADGAGPASVRLPGHDPQASGGPSRGASPPAPPGRG